MGAFLQYTKSIDYIPCSIFVGIILIDRKLVNVKRNNLAHFALFLGNVFRTTTYPIEDNVAKAYGRTT